VEGKEYSVDSRAPCEPCTPCDGEGQVVVAACTPLTDAVCGCDAGYVHVADTGGDSGVPFECSMCGAGTAAAAGAAACSTCAPGSAAAAGSGECTPCTFGVSFANASGAAECAACRTCSGALPVLTSACRLVADATCGALGASPSSLPRQPSTAPSASASPGTQAVAGALTFSGVPVEAFANPATLALLAASITSSVTASLNAAAAGGNSSGGSKCSVAITGITDVATGAQLYSAPGSRRRRLVAAPGSMGVSVQYAVLLPPGANVAAVTAAVRPAASGSSSAASAAFTASVVATVKQLSAASGDVTLSAGFGAATAAAAAPTARPTPVPETDSGGQSRLGAIVGGACAGVIVLTLLGGCLYCCGCCGSGGNGAAAGGAASPVADTGAGAKAGSAFDVTNPMQQRQQQALAPIVVRSAKGDRPLVGRGRGRAAGVSAV
jgi:hypothetical protein